jgi:hypothetical protein
MRANIIGAVPRANKLTPSLPRLAVVPLCALRAGATRRPNHSTPVQPAREKYFRFHLTQITSLFRPSRSSEGRLAIVTDAGRDAVDAEGTGRGVGLAGRGASMCLVSGPAETSTTVADADGEVAWSWRPLLASRGEPKVKSDRPEQLTPDGDKTNSSPGRARRNPLKPSRGECRAYPASPWFLTRVLSTHCTRGRGRRRRPALPAPSHF